MGRRVHIPEVWLDWHPSGVKGRRRWGRRSMAAPRAQVLDLSLTGARVLVANEPELRRGTEVRIELDSASGRCRIARVDPGAAGMIIYGIQYLDLEPALRETINGLVSADRKSLDLRWEHTR